MDRTAEAPPVAPYQTDEMITAAEVAKVTGLNRRRVAQAAAAGHLTTFRPPSGVPGLVRYGRRSAEALARSMTTPATHHPPGSEPDAASTTSAEFVPGATTSHAPAAADPAAAPALNGEGDPRHGE